MPNATCSIDGCELAKHQRGWCVMHYTRVRRYGTLELKTTFSCVVCSIEFEKSGTGPRPKYCSRSCKRSLVRLPAPSDGLCMGCRTPLPPQGKGRTRKYCRPQCRGLYQTHKSGRPASKTCIHCDTIIDMTIRMADGRLRYPAYIEVCESCSKYRKPNRYPLTAAHLAERDGPACAGCGIEVDFAAMKPDPFSPSVDHIVPWSRGGANESHNLQLMHLRCNIVKGVKLDK